MPQPGNINFRTATRRQAKACIAIDGLSGTGKSGLALLLGHALAGNWESVFCNDTEQRSLDLFDGIKASIGEEFGHFKKYDLLPMYGYAPSTYLAIKEAAKKNGAKVFINDSATHMWTGPGGILSLVGDAKAKDAKMDNYRVWGLPQIKSEKDKIVDVLRDSDLHVISTIRVKEKFDMVTGDDGRTKLQSLGEQQIMMPDLKYEPDLVFSMVSPGTIMGKPPVVRVTKSRYAIFEKDQLYEITPTILTQLVSYLNEGADPEELKKQQKTEIIAMITALLKENQSKATMFPYLLQQSGIQVAKNKDGYDLSALELATLKSIYVQLLS